MPNDLPTLLLDFDQAITKWGLWVDKRTMERDEKSGRVLYPLDKVLTEPRERPVGPSAAQAARSWGNLPGVVVR